MLDRLAVLYWLKGNNELKQFAKNRVVSIKRNAPIERWKHSPGKDNPVDLISRRLKLRTKLVDSMWWRGPEWLCQEEKHWPGQTVELSCAIKEEIDKECKADSSKVMVACIGEAN